jgi:hypothetical protein
VVTTSDFSSAFNVRGGSADQNLILLDGQPVFNPTHLGGFFSVFNADMIERAELQSGGFPARFGGRVSSVLDIHSDPGDGQLNVDAGISLLATRLAVGAGLPESLEEKAGLRDARWRVSGRRSYFDQVLKAAFDFPYHLTDLQGVFEGWTRGGDRVALTAYTGRDVLELTRLDPEDFPLRIDWKWGNDLVGLSFTNPRRDGGDTLCDHDHRRGREAPLREQPGVHGGDGIFQRGRGRHRALRLCTGRVETLAGLARRGRFESRPLVPNDR